MIDGLSMCSTGISWDFPPKRGRLVILSKSQMKVDRKRCSERIGGLVAEVIMEKI